MKNQKLESNSSEITTVTVNWAGSWNSGIPRNYKTVVIYELYYNVISYYSMVVHDEKVSVIPSIEIASLFMLRLKNNIKMYAS